MFPTARVIVIELHDDEAGLHVDGPVGRILAGGAEGYLVASSGESIARLLSPPAEAERGQAGQLGAGRMSADDLLLEQLDELAALRADAC